MTTLDMLRHLVLSSWVLYLLVRVVRVLDPRWCHGCDRRDGTHGVGCETEEGERYGD